jgi:DNA (cytosine-5)-methyltransferase 1
VGGEAATLQASDARLSNQVSGLISPMGVRRLTPLECERLQGWPDDHTRWTHDGKEIPDSHRYRMIGNGVVAPVAEWIGHRLMWVDSL